jgi:serine/threonine protein kinase
VAVKKLGAGGMGTVYLCEHTMIDRKVAVKVLHDEHALDAEQVERFFQEARAAAEIGHPNIIVIIDAGWVTTPTGRAPYMMMEALDGMSLDKRWSRRPRPRRDPPHHGAVHLGADRQPRQGHHPPRSQAANIFLCHHAFDPMFVKILDFGIAKLTTPASTSARPSSASCSARRRT